MSSIIAEICQLFCCPPRPSHIVAKLAFLPPNPTYTIISAADESSCRIEFKPEAGWLMSDEAKSKLEVFYTVTKRQSRIVCLYIAADSVSSMYNPSGLQRSTNGPRVCQPGSMATGDTSRQPLTVLFSHGNAVDIGQMAGFLQSLACRFGVNIMCYDYSGYGASSGQRLEENLYADVEAVLGELLERYKVPLDRIVLYGQSIGSAPTVELATKYEVAGVVLHSALMSGMRVVCPGTTSRFCFDPFANIDKVSKIRSPTLVIHGTDDEVIGIHHGRELYARLTRPLEPAWIEGAGHNDIELFTEYTHRLDRFFNEEMNMPHELGVETSSSVTTTMELINEGIRGSPPLGDGGASAVNAAIHDSMVSTVTRTHDNSGLTSTLLTGATENIPDRSGELSADVSPVVPSVAPLTPSSLSGDQTISARRYKTGGGFKASSPKSYSTEALHPAADSFNDTTSKRMSRNTLDGAYSSQLFTSPPDRIGPPIQGLATHSTDADVLSSSNISATPSTTPTSAARF